MSRLSHSTETLGQETKGYIDSQLDLVKLRSIKGLSQGTSAIVGLLLIFLIAGALMTVLLLALVLWLGEILNSYALASLIVAGVLLVLLVLLFARRRYLFRNSFVSMYTDVFFPEEAWPAWIAWTKPSAEPNPVFGKKRQGFPISCSTDSVGPHGSSLSFASSSKS